MRTLLLVSLAVGLVVATSGVADAEPTFGNGHCSDCHTSLTPDDALDMTSATTADPAQWDDGFGNSGGRGPLPSFVVAPGGTVALTGLRTGDDPGSNAALNMYRWFKNGNTGSPLAPHIVAGSGSPDWTETSDGDGPYFYQYVQLERGAFSFDLTVDAATPLGIYDLETYLAGSKFLPGGGVNAFGDKWQTGQHYYLEVVPEPGSIALLGLAGLGLFAVRRRK